MAENSPNSIGWLLELPREHSDWLAGIRHWRHLKVATEGDSIWVNGFSESEIASTAIKSIPAKKIWHQMDHQLFPQGSRLPFRQAPVLLWTPIGRGLPLALPDENHNFFGIKEETIVRLVRTEIVHPAVAILAPVEALRAFIENAAAVRLKHLQWVMIDETSAFILGAPLLPVPGNTFWQCGSFLMPAGYDFEWPVIRDILHPLTDTMPGDVVVWDTAGSWFSIPHMALSPLTIGSFRQSLLRLRAKQSNAL